LRPGSMVLMWVTNCFRARGEEHNHGDMGVGALPVYLAGSWQPSTKSPPPAEEMVGCPQLTRSPPTPRAEEKGVNLGKNGRSWNSDRTIEVEIQT
jgi:hypothetical protein